jgi:hypothetical protein
MDWTKEAAVKKMREISAKGFIPLPEDKKRSDDGGVGQVLEHEFGVHENNLHEADLGTIELKAMRLSKHNNNLTLFHQKPSSGKSMMDIFDAYSYEALGKRDQVRKKKLFTTIKGDRVNNRGFILSAKSDSEIELYHNKDYVATWDLSDEYKKLNQVLFARAETRGVQNSDEEEFHFTEAYYLSKPKSLSEAIKSGAVVMDFCIDQPVGSAKGPHDRGPHIRIPVKKLNKVFENVEVILPKKEEK